MKKILYLILLLPLAVSAQCTLVAEIGASGSLLLNDKIVGGTKPVISKDIQLRFSHAVSEHIQLGISAGYTSLRVKNSINYVDVNANPIGTVTTKYHLANIGIPIKLEGRLYNEGKSSFRAIGLSAGVVICTGAKQNDTALVTSGTDNRYFANNTAFTGGLSIEYGRFVSETIRIGFTTGINAVLASLQVNNSGNTSKDGTIVNIPFRLTLSYGLVGRKAGS